MGCRDLLVERKTKSRTLGQVHVSVLLSGKAVEHLEVVWLVELGVVLLYQEVGQRRAQVEAGRRPNGEIRVVRSHEYVLRLRYGGNLLELGDPAATQLSGRDRIARPATDRESRPRQSGRFRMSRSRPSDSSERARVFLLMIARSIECG